jgi:DnaK suppressor protein
MRHEQTRKALPSERAKLIGQLEKLGATEDGELKAGLGLDKEFADAGAVTVERTKLLGLADSLYPQVQKIDAAAVSIDEDSYGTCASCGEAIPPARLEARPSSLLCVACKTNR